MRKTLMILALVLVVLATGVSALGLNDSLVRYYSFDNDTIINDSIANEQATNSGAVWSASGKIGGAFQYDETQSDYVYIANNDTYDFTGSWSMQAWFNSNKNDGNRRIISRGGAGEDFYLIVHNTDKVRAGFQSGYTPQYLDSATSIGNALNQWFHVVATYNASDNRFRVYINGSLDATSSAVSGSASPTNWQVNFGCGRPSDGAPTECFDYKIDEVGFWSRALGADEVTTLWNSSNGVPISNILNFSAPVVTSYFTVTGEDSWSGDTVENFSMVVSGVPAGISTYNTNNGTIVTQIDPALYPLLNFTLTGNQTGYSFTSTSKNVPSNVTFAGKLNGAVITFLPTEVLTTATITEGNFSVSDGVKTINQVYDSTFNLTNGTFNITFSSDNYPAQTQTASFSKGDGYPALFPDVYQFKFNVTALSAASSTPINNFTVRYVCNFGLSGTIIVPGNESPIIYPACNNTLTTTTGTVSFKALNENYTITLIESNGFAFAGKNSTGYFNITNKDVQFSLYTANSFLVNFLSETDSSIIDYINITLFAFGSVDSVNDTTSNGTVYVDLLTPDSYTLKAFPESIFSDREIYITVSENTFQNLTFYLGNASVLYNITASVVDESASPVEGVVVELYKQLLPANTMILVGSRLTDSNGEAPFDAEINGANYKWIVKRNSVVEFESSAAVPIIRDLITLPISSGFTSNGRWNTVYNTGYVLSKEGSNGVVLSWTSNEVSAGNLTVYDSNNTVLYSNYSTSGTSIRVYVDNTTNASYTVKGFLTISSEDRYVGSQGFLFDVKPENFNSIKWVLSLIIILVITFIAVWNPTVMFVMQAVALIMLKSVGLLPMSAPLLSGMIALMVFLAYIVGREA